MPVAWGQRKALGRRYAIDPALIMEQQNLAQQYALAPGREARAEQTRQFEATSAENARRFDIQSSRDQERFDKSQSQAATAGLTNLAGSILISDIVGNKGGGIKWVWDAANGMFTPAKPTPAIPNTPAASPSPSVSPTNTEVMPIQRGESALSPKTTSQLGETSTPATVDSSITAEASAAGTSSSASGSAYGGTNAGIDIGTESAYGAGEGAGTAAGGTAGYAGLWAAAALAGKKAFGGDPKEPASEKGFVEKTFSAPAISGAPGFDPIVTTVADTVLGKDNPISKLNNKLADIESSTVRSIFGTWICTAVQNSVGIDDEDKTALYDLRKYCLRVHPGWLHWYLDEGQKIVDGIEEMVPFDVLENTYKYLKDTFVLPVTALVKTGDMEGAYNYYLNVSQYLCRQYAPEVEIKEHTEVS